MEEKKVHIPRVMTLEEIKAVRAKLELSQRNLCIRYGLPMATLKNWKQGRTVLDIAASLYLLQIDKCPITTAENVVEWIAKSNSLVA